MFKRSITFMLFLALLAALLPVAATNGELVNIDTPLPKDIRVTSMVYHHGQVLLSSNDGIYSYKPGGEEIVFPIKLDAFPRETGSPPAISVLATDESGALHGVNVSAQDSALYSLTLEGDQLKLGERVDLEVQEGLSAPRQVLMSGGRLYMLFRVFGDYGAQITLISFDAKVGGEPRTHNAQRIQHLARYKDGQLLALLITDDDNYQTGGRPMRAATLGTFDPVSDTVQSMGPTGFPFNRQAHALNYESETDSIFLLGAGKIYRKQGQGDVELSAYYVFVGEPDYYVVGRDADTHSLVLTTPGQAAVFAAGHLAIRSTDPALLPEALTIYGMAPDEAMTQAVRAMKDMPVTFLDDTYFHDAQQLGRALETETAGIDIYFSVSDSIDLAILSQKAYALDLSGNKTFTDHAAFLYPLLTRAGATDGRLRMLPVEVHGDLAMSYYPEVFKEIGLEPPKTFKAFTEFMQEWNDSLVREHPEVAPFGRTHADEPLKEIALELYSHTAAGEGREFSFADPLLRRLLEEASSPDLSNISMPYGEDNKRHLFENYGRLDLGGLNSAMAQEGISRLKGYRSEPLLPLPLSADETGKPYAALTLTLAAINPGSKNIGAAVKFLELYLQNLPPDRILRVNPQPIEAVPNPDYEREAGYIDRELAAAKDALAAAQGGEKTALQQTYDLLVKNAEPFKERLRFITAPAIRLYGDILANGYIRTYSGISELFENQGISYLYESFLQKKISLDQFLADAGALEQSMRQKDK